MRWPTPPFDEAIIVDWSAAASPTTGTDSCWVATGSLTDRSRVLSTNYRTRCDTMEAVTAKLDANLHAGKRTLLAVDVSFGFPAGFVARVGLPGHPAWRALWQALEARGSDDERNANNRFSVADAINAESKTQLFWGRPAASSFEQFSNLPIKNVVVPGLRPNPLARLRSCESLAGPGVISNWMLVGKGAVGGQVLTCLPYLERLRQHLGSSCAVWPFDGLGDVGTDVVLAETWFGLYDWKSERGSCRDEQQVRGTLKSLRSCSFDDLLTPKSFVALEAKQQRTIMAEEGWTLGVR